jgi:hypothetical protein
MYSYPKTLAIFKNQVLTRKKERERKTFYMFLFLNRFLRAFRKKNKKTDFRRIEVVS